MTKFKNISAGIDHNRFHKDVTKLLDKYAGKLTAQEMLALSARLVGQLIAMQDQRKLTSEEAMGLVIENIRNGNLQVIAELQKTKGNA